MPPVDLDASGAPDFVELVADTYEEALDFYSSEGFRAPISDASIPDNGGDARFDVYLLDFFGSADGSFQAEPTCDADICPGYVARPEGRGEVAVSLVEGQALHVLVAARRGDQTVVDGPHPGPHGARIDAEGADAIVIGVVHAAFDGPSDRASVCAGSPEEVEACALAAGDAASDAGPSSDAEPPHDAGADAGQAAEPDGCAAGGSSNNSHTNPFLGLVLVVACRARRSRQSIKLGDHR